MAKGQNSAGSQTKSELKTGAERFLVHVTSRALDENWRTPDDFLRHFKPQDLMASLEKAPDLRAALLVKAAGVHEKIARKKSTSSAAEDLRIALDERVTTAGEILALFPPDDRVRYLDKAKLWAFVTEEQFWTDAKDAKDRERNIDRVLFFVEQALEQHLVTLQDVADGLTFETIASRLPKAELEKVVLHALKTGRRKAALTEPSLLEVVPLRDLLKYVPLEHTYKGVVVAKIAQPSGFSGGDEGWDAGAASMKGEAKAAAPAPAPAPEKPLESKVEVKAEAPQPAPAPAPEKQKSSPPPAPSPVEEAKETVEAGELLDDNDPAVVDEEVDNLVPSTRSAAEEEARRRVIDRLRAVNRLPPKHADLSTPLLLSIDSMYADLLSASTDEAREMCIRESFPNEQQLTTALLALIALLDPSIDVNDPVIKEADVDSLIKVVLFEERHRYEQAHPSARPPTPPPPANVSGPRRSVTPPPLPRSNAPMPPPPPPPAELKR
jgi:hypothetical protein